MTEAIVVSNPGSYEVLETRNVKVHKPKKGEVLISQKAIGINYIDLEYRSGKISQSKYPIIPGIEAAGYIEEIGEGVENFKIGDRVAYATVANGGYAKERIIDARYILNIPDEISFEIAAASLAKGLMAHYLIKRVYYVKPKNYVLVRDPTNGVGQILCQWLKYLKANVIGIIDKEEKRQIAESVGCDYILNENHSDIVSKVKEYSNNNLSVIFNSKKCNDLTTLLQSLGRYGLFTMYDQALADNPTIDLSILRDNSLFITSPNFFSYKEHRYELILSTYDVFEYVKNNIINVNIAKTYTLSEANEAHQDLEEDRIFGSSIFIV